MTQQTSQAQEFEEEVPEFYIPANVSALESRPRTLKHGDTFAVFDHYGDAGGTEAGPEGLYHEDTRHLSRLRLTIDGSRCLLLSSTVKDDNSVLMVDLANPDIMRGGRIVLPRDQLHITRSKFLWQGGCYERLSIRNFDRNPHRFRLGLRFAADFVDLFEVRGQERPRRGRRRIDRLGPDAIALRYVGLDHQERSTRIDFAPQPTALNDDEAIYNLALEPGQRLSLFITIRCNDETPAERGAYFVKLRHAAHALRGSTARFAVIDSSNALLNRILCRSVADLYMLLTDTPQGPYPYAGIPWFSTAFGRDGLITALEMLWLDPDIAKGVLKFLAATQATGNDYASEAEPGRILHETRRGEMARLGEVPFGLYYGTVDATPLFILLAGRYFARTGDLATIQSLWPHIEAALHWIDTFGDVDRDGFVEYRARDGKGLTNQGWKDSEDSIFHADGRLVQGAIALVEVQAYVYAAKRCAAELSRALRRSASAARLDHQADILAERFDQAFWCEELGTYALALDGDKQPCRVKASNAGHTLFTDIAPPSRAARVIQTLMARDSFSGWGIRTLATSELRYNPMSYHNGSVWPHDNALIAMGLARYGYREECVALFEGLFEAAQHMDQLRLPELFCGFPRRPARAPVLYPVACSPQAWASATPLSLLEACLGLHCDVARREIRFERPMLPAFIDELRLRRLKLGDAQVDILLRRHDRDVAVNVLARTGDVRVVVVN